MPRELPKKLPMQREVDHTIELEPKAKPLAIAPYCMAPPELKELRRQLKKLFDGWVIRLSKDPMVIQFYAKRRVMGAFVCAPITGH